MTTALLGIDLGGTSVKLGVCEANGVVRRSAVIPTTPDRGGDDTIARIAAAAREVVNADTIAACGIGVPGELDVTRRLLVRANHFPGWADVPIGDHISETLGVPAVLENDANCAAWGELCAGAARGARSVVCFTLGTGVGGAVIIDGALWTGVNGAAGALGHIAVDPNGPECRCGQRGCVEQYASATSIARRYGRGSARDAFDAATRRDPDAMSAVDWACDGLAAGIANTIHIVQPEVVVLAGGVAGAGDALVGRVRAGVARRVRRAWLADIRIELSALGDNAGWVGAALWAGRHANIELVPS